jgi:hypothetical protein
MRCEIAGRVRSNGPNPWPMRGRLFSEKRMGPFKVRKPTGKGLSRRPRQENLRCCELLENMVSE